MQGGRWRATQPGSDHCKTGDQRASDPNSAAIGNVAETAPPAPKPVSRRTSRASRKPALAFAQGPPAGRSRHCQPDQHLTHTPVVQVLTDGFAGYRGRDAALGEHVLLLWPPPPDP